MLTALELLSLSPTRLDLMDTLESHLLRPHPPKLQPQLLQLGQLLTSLLSSDSSLTSSSPRSAPLSRPPSPAPTMSSPDKSREWLSPPVVLPLLSLLETTQSGSKLLSSTLSTRALMTEQQP